MASYSVSIKGKTFRCGENDYIIDKAEYNNIDLPYSCRAGSCSTCLCILSEGSVDQSDGSFLTSNQMQSGLVSVCIAKPKSDVTLNPASEKFKELLEWGGSEGFYEVDSNIGAAYHYFFGGGVPVTLGPLTTSLLENHPRQQEAVERLQAGITQPNGNYSVPMTSYMFHVGDTGVNYTTICSGGTCTTTFVGFTQSHGGAWSPDGVWDVYDLEENFGIQGVEVPFGTPYAYIPHVWTETYADPGFH